jgi:hypothetical protein
MTPTVISDVSIADIVYDHMIIEVNNPLFQDRALQYAISNNEHQILRKGSFSGRSVQLWVAHLPEGKYSFSITGEGINEHVYFEKRVRRY